MQVDINLRSGRPGIVSSEIQERIKCRGRIRIQKCVPQSRLASFADRQILPFVPRITKTQLPVPRLEIIDKFSHLTLETNIKEIIVVSELFMSWTGVVDAAKQNAGCEWKTRSVSKEIWDLRIRNSQLVNRMRDCQT